MKTLGCILTAAGVLLAAILMQVAWSAPAGHAAAQADYFVTPTHSFIAVAERCTLYVEAAATGDSLGCIESWVTFDTSLVTLVQADEAELFRNIPYPRLFFWQVIAADTQSVEGCILGPGTYTMPPGKMVRYVFEAKAEGTCHAKITRLNLWDIDRVMFTPQADTDAWIYIGQDFPTGTRPPGPAGSLRAQPNPFNPSTTLVLSIDAADVGSVAIYQTDGRLVRHLFDGALHAGTNRFVWDGRDELGRRVSSGVYFGVARYAAGTQTTKLVLVQ